MTNIKNDWALEEISELMASPILDLLFDAQMIHRQHFKKNEIQLSTLLSIKTGACPEDCAYCPQSGHYNTNLEKEKLYDVEPVIKAATLAKANGATRFCMGAAWRKPPKKAIPAIKEMIKAVKDLGLESCMTLGMLDDDDVSHLKDAGLDYYNHNIDTSKDYYEKIITTRTFDDRLETLDKVRKAGINVCCGGIMGMGETRADRVQFIHHLATMEQHPESVPINRLIKIKGTPLEQEEDLIWHEFVRTIACARITMPKSHVRLSAGRESMSDELQTLCFMAGANSIFLGDKLLTAKNPGKAHDITLMEQLGLVPEVA